MRTSTAAAAAARCCAKHIDSIRYGVVYDAGRKAVLENHIYLECEVDLLQR